jgi:hypothetical protein
LLTDGDALRPGDSYKISSDNSGDPFIFTSSRRVSRTVTATGAGCGKILAGPPTQKRAGVKRISTRVSRTAFLPREGARQCRKLISSKVSSYLQKKLAFYLAHFDCNNGLAG